jgi:hypothetical protein
MASRRHVFISHHHADDRRVTEMTDMLKRNGYEIRNSSIRAKPENQRRLDERRVSDNTIRRLLRMKMSWASTVIVLIGKETAQRPWVDWEIQRAHQLGKRIVGVYERGGTENDIPQGLENYASSIVNWNTNSIVAAVNGENTFQTPDGQPRAPVHERSSSRC